MDRETALAEIAKLIEEQNGITVSDREETLAIDSFTIVLILTFAEQQLGIALDTDRLDFENFETLAKIEDAVFSGRYTVADA